MSSATASLANVSPDVVASLIATDLKRAEHGHDASMVHKLELAASLLNGRLQIGVAAEVGQSAFDLLGRAIANDFESRKLMVQAHRRLLQTGASMGVDHTLGGPTAPKPGEGDPDSPYKGATGALTVVAA
ncbi:hypothetical protein BH10PSE1_BH10PSE1_21540 [soil metagenome]